MPDLDRQPDQQPRRWDDHVEAYEAVFEPLTNRFADAALRALSPPPGERLLDVGAGSGGAALMAAELGAEVVAIDASSAMAARIRARAARFPNLRSAVMDATSLALADESVASALSVFGVILCPDPADALREIGRVLAPGGRVAVVTWTEPERYELAARLIAAIAAIRGPQPPPAAKPAQLRFAAEEDFRRLFSDAGLSPERIERVEARLEAPSARWLADRLDFAPGLAAMLAAQEADRERVVARFAEELERDQGLGPVGLRAVAFIGLARR